MNSLPHKDENLLWERMHSRRVQHGSASNSVVLTLAPNRTLQLAVRVALTLGMALVVFLLAFAQRDFALDQMRFPVNGKGYAGIAFLLDRRVELFELSVVEQ